LPINALLLVVCRIEVLKQARYKSAARAAATSEHRTIPSGQVKYSFFVTSNNFGYYLQPAP
jgi:hypothetical protein